MPLTRSRGPSARACDHASAPRRRLLNLADAMHRDDGQKAPAETRPAALAAATGARDRLSRKANEQRRGRDSNPRSALKESGFKTSAFNRSVTPPERQSLDASRGEIDRSPGLKRLLVLKIAGVHHTRLSDRP